MAPSTKRGRSKGPPPRKDDSSSSDTQDAHPQGLHVWDEDDDSDAGPSKTRLAPSVRNASSGTRHARFGSQLEQGPTPSRGRSQSPSRSALANPERYNDQASAQLQGEADAEQFSSAVVSQPAHTTSFTFDIPLAGIEDEKKQDDEMTKALHKLREKIFAFGKSFANTREVRTQNVVDVLCSDRENLQLVRYIGSLAMGGSKGIEGWKELLRGEALGALVAGIVGRALKEQVFSALWFGGCEDQNGTLSNQEQKQADLDGFARTKDRAIHCKGFLREAHKHAREHKDCNLASVSRSAEATIAAKLEKLLTPLWTLSQTTTLKFNDSTRQALRTVVSDAAYLAREMRTLDSVVYYWPPTFKDEEFEPARMECYNLTTMIDSSPYKKRTISGRETAVLQDGQEGRKEAIVRIVAFPGLVAYRKGGGQLALQQLELERSQDDNAPEDVKRVRRTARDSPHNLTGKEGFRTRILGKSVVVLEWGRQRLLTKEAGTSVHLDAVRDRKLGRYENDREGFVELFDEFLRKWPGAGKATA